MSILYPFCGPIMGYANPSTETGNKYIAPKQPLAGLIQCAFQETASAKYAIDQVWKQAKEKGLKVGRNHFRNIMQNPVYCGKIVINKHKDE